MKKVIVYQDGAGAEVVYVNGTKAWESFSGRYMPPYVPSEVLKAVELSYTVVHVSPDVTEAAAKHYTNFPESQREMQRLVDEHARTEMVKRKLQLEAELRRVNKFLDPQLPVLNLPENPIQED